MTHISFCSLLRSYRHSGKYFYHIFLILFRIRKLIIDHLALVCGPIIFLFNAHYYTVWSAHVSTAWSAHVSTEWSAHVSTARSAHVSTVWSAHVIHRLDGTRYI